MALKPRNSTNQELAISGYQARALGLQERTARGAASQHEPRMKELRRLEMQVFGGEVGSVAFRGVG
jgi:hypothetical protein